MLAHPADLSGRHPNHQRVRLDIAVDDGAGANERILANGGTADDGAVGTESRASHDQRATVFVLAVDRRSRVVNVGEHHTWPTEDIVFQRNGIVDGDIVLDLHVVADEHIIADENILPQRALLADFCAAADMDPVPDARSFAELGTFVNDSGGMDLCCHLQCTFRFSFSARARLVVHLPPKTVSSLPLRWKA